MKPLKWKRKYNIGIARIDQQHRQLLGLINIMILAANGDGKDEAVSEALTRMTRYASEHFALEEELMERYGFPGFAEHRAHHMEFRRKTTEFCQEATDNHGILNDDILEYLAEWLLSHILGEDKKYQDHFAELGLCRSLKTTPPAPSGRFAIP